MVCLCNVSDVPTTVRSVMQDLRTDQSVGVSMNTDRRLLLGQPQTFATGDAACLRMRTRTGVCLTGEMTDTN